MKRQILGLLLVVGMVCLGSMAIMAAELTPEAEAARAVSGISVEVSSVHNSGSGGGHLVDGDLSTTTKRWISKLGDQEPVATLTLAQEALIDTVVVYSGFGDKADGEDVYTADSYVIEALQGVSWVEVAHVQGNVAVRSITTFTAVKASAWRVRFIKSNTLGTSDNRARVFEIRLLAAQ